MPNINAQSQTTVEFVQIGWQFNAVTN